MQRDGYRNSRVVDSEFFWELLVQIFHQLLITCHIEQCLKINGE